MRKSVFFVLLVLIGVSCRSKQVLENKVTTVNEIGTFEYGYTPENPIKVGGIKDNRGPQNQIEYLKDLTDLEGNNLSFYRVGSCCHFDTPNGLFNGRGVLDIYAVYIKGKQDTVRLYLNLYDEDKLYAPRGFKFKL
ncbi:hypothetical protein [Myroides profundi]|uniref:2-dehydro-3-deoxyphosphooctonate aldolase n=1 Tax=Myroides profundi TaxID=480520 RepID=A0AAJ4W287_MYRPR|nr:hypothetical protein [Myroides profundi]AJH14080.1 hypothetical protein MPR_0889 [Myroides profundi]SEQ43511.1 hypothetical protein SAMN04488089_103132 [Myroides profundi]